MCAAVPDGLYQWMMHFIVNDLTVTAVYAFVCSVSWNTDLTNIVTWNALLTNTSLLNA